MRERSHRDHININIQVSDEQGGRLGHITDLSIGGLSLSGKGDMPNPLPAALVLALPWPVNGLSTLHLGVEERWHEYSDDGRWHAGFRVTQCGEPELVALEQLVSRFQDD